MQILRLLMICCVKQAKGDWPGEFKESQWVKTNVHYGYGCACLTMLADPGSRVVSRILRAEQLPVARCAADRALPPR